MHKHAHTQHSQHTEASSHIRTTTTTASTQSFCSAQTKTNAKTYRMNHTDGCRSNELGPVLCLAQPLQIVAQKRVDGRAAVHQRVAHDGGVVRDGVARLLLVL